MSLCAPLRIPVELTRNPGERWFSLASQVSTAGLRFLPSLPESLEGRFEVRFQLPGDAEPIACRGVRSGDGLGFTDLGTAQKQRVETYVSERLGLT